MFERPQYKDIPKIAADWSLPDDYERSVISREREQLLPWANQSIQRREEVYFATNRGYIAHFAWPYLEQLLAVSDQPRHVLEIGGGEGKALLEMIMILSSCVPIVPSVLFTMTSLTEQPEQQDLLQYGVDLRIPQIAERLPSEWTSQFDLVMSSAVLGWANANFAIPEIRRVLRPGGFWIGLELFDGRPIYEETTLQGLVHGVMVNQRMENRATHKEFESSFERHQQFPIVYQKE